MNQLSARTEPWTNAKRPAGYGGISRFTLLLALALMTAASAFAADEPTPAASSRTPEVRSLASAYAEALTQRLGIQAEGFDVEGRPAFVLLPRELTSHQPWIMYAPALPDYPDTHERWMHEQFVSRGVAVAGVDVGEAYGSPDGRAAMSSLYRTLVDDRGFAPKVCLFGRSRGGLWALSWAGENLDKVAGIVGIYPAFDLRTYPGLEKAAPAYGLTDAELKGQLDRHNPINLAPKLGAARIPAFFIHGLKDELVPFRENAGQFAAAYRAAGVPELATVIAPKDQGHNFWDGFFTSKELVDFAIERAASAGKDAVEPTANSPRAALPTPVTSP